MTDAVPDPDCPGCQVLLGRVEELSALATRLQARIEELEARLRQDSSNSHRPPSSDPPWLRPKGGGGKGRRRRGGQEGHRRHERKLMPPDEVHCLKPPACESCGESLSGEDRSPRRHQVTELPPVRAVVSEYRLHALTCRACGHRTRARLPAGVPSSAFGARLQATVALLTGVYRISRRNARQLLADAFNVQISTGAISKLESRITSTLEGPYLQALRTLRREHVVHSDETGWREADRSAWLWGGVSRRVSAFLIRPSRGSVVSKELIGENFPGFHVSDRWSAYGWIHPRRRQVCWAHLVRDFRKIADSGRESRWIGEALLQWTGELFGYWHRVRDGTMKRSTLARHARRIRRHICALLRIGADCRISRASSLSRGILELESAMWTFVKHEGIEPTNNDAERGLRPAVLWRKTSQGTQSARGSRYVERILTCAATLHRRGHNVMDYLAVATTAALNGRKVPSFVR
jgi:transposase